MLSKDTKILTLNKYFLPYDIYERHKVVGGLIKNAETVVDIGGELNLLSQFCQPTKLIVANLTSGDVIIEKNNLPFGKNTFDVVTSIDVLEHIPKAKRKEFINHLIKIAKKRVILSFPIGTSKHISYEKKIQKFLEEREIDVKYIKEHIAYGLPTALDVNNYFEDFKVRIFYSGNIIINEFLFRIFIFDPKIKYVRKIVYFLKLFFNFVTNPIFYSLLTYKNYSDWVNRAYVIIEIDQK